MASWQDRCKKAATCGNKQRALGHESMRTPTQFGEMILQPDDFARLQGHATCKYGCPQYSTTATINKHSMTGK
jgi:hypothetical protein